MPNAIQAQRGLISPEDFVGPATYDSAGGFTHTTNLGRVNTAIVEVDDGQWDARVDSVSDEDVVIRVYSQSTGVEAPDETDLSGDNFTLVGYRL